LTSPVTSPANPIATTHLPFFITAPGQTDVLYNITLVFVVASVVGLGIFFWTIHSLPERMAHRSKKIQMDVVALLGLIGLFTHEHAFWIAALLLAWIDIPDFFAPFRRLATAVETIAGQDAAGSPAGQPGSNEAKTASADTVSPASESGSDAMKIEGTDRPRQDKKGSVRA
jgi:hypothetical protein